MVLIALGHCFCRLRWEAQGNRPGFANLALALFDAAASVVPGALFMVEGTGQIVPGESVFLLRLSLFAYAGPGWTAAVLCRWHVIPLEPDCICKPLLDCCCASAGGMSYNWGDGLAAQPQVVSQYPGISDASTFFEQVVTRPYANRVIVGEATAVHLHLSWQPFNKGQAVLSVSKDTRRLHPLCRSPCLWACNLWCHGQLLRVSTLSASEPVLWLPEQAGLLCQVYWAVPPVPCGPGGVWQQAAGPP